MFRDAYEGCVVVNPVQERFATLTSLSFPADYRPGIGIIGCGSVVRANHLPAYRAHGLRIVGAYDISPEATMGVEEAFGVEQVFASVDELLDHPEIEVVDIATGPGPRTQLITQAIKAGKHVLSQKPLAPDLGSARQIVEEAGRMGIKVTVNQNGRYAPSWRVTELVERGEVGEVISITHLIDRDFEFIVGTHYDEITHLLIYDYAIHGIDITRCWLRGKDVSVVRASAYRVPNQPPESAAPWGAGSRWASCCRRSQKIASQPTRLATTCSRCSSPSQRAYRLRTGRGQWVSTRSQGPPGRAKPAPADSRRARRERRPGSGGRGGG